MSSAPHIHTAIVPMTSVRRPKRDRAAEPQHRDAADQIGDENRAEQRRRQIERRRGEHEAHIGEQRDEIEQRAEADRVDREQPRIAQVAQHLPRRGGEALGAHEIALARQDRGHREAAREQVTAAKTMKPLRQPTVSASTPEKKRPQNPPMLVADI